MAAGYLQETETLAKVSVMQDALSSLQARYPDLEPCMADIETAFGLLRDTFAGGGKLLVCGNGGSAADSDHIVGELMKGFQLKRPIKVGDRLNLLGVDDERGQHLADHLQGALPAIALTAQAALTSAIFNDIGADMVYAQQVYGYGAEGDCVIGISTSGTSANVINALHVGRAQGLNTIGLTGRGGGDMASVCDVVICAPYDDTMRIQERHLPIYHTLCVMLEREFFNG